MTVASPEQRLFLAVLNQAFLDALSSPTLNLPVREKFKDTKKKTGAQRHAIATSAAERLYMLAQRDRNNARAWLAKEGAVSHLCDLAGLDAGYCLERIREMRARDWSANLPALSRAAMMARAA